MRIRLKRTTKKASICRQPEQYSLFIQLKKQSTEIQEACMIEAFLSNSFLFNMMNRLSSLIRIEGICLQIGIIELGNIAKKNYFLVLSEKSGIELILCTRNP